VDGSPDAIPGGARFRGFFSFRGAARVMGELDGQVVAEGILLVGESARVTAKVEVDELDLAGVLSGEVSARERVVLRATARFEGILSTPSLEVEEGALVRGTLRVGSSTPARSAAAS
jgi:cytoskeletal protein CcmA (bactofilin family)